MKNKKPPTPEEFLDLNNGYLPQTFLKNCPKDIQDKFIELMNNQIECPPEFSKIIDEHFWDLLGD